jgi:outer membrane immunogenic protein
MRKVLGLIGATLLLAGPALAADLAVKPPAYAAPAPALWTGFYLGIHGGYGWGHDSVESPEFTLVFSNPSPKGGVFGGQAGYNWQYGSFVGGLEIDGSAANLKERQQFNPPPNCCDAGALSSKIDYFGSARARAGIVVMPDWLLYGTAGLALAHDSVTSTRIPAVCVVPLCLGVGNSTASSDHVGWAAGAGVEYRIWQNLLLRAEYLHYGFGSEGYTFITQAGGGGLLANFSSKLSVDVARGGLSYKF